MKKLIFSALLLLISNPSFATSPTSAPAISAPANFTGTYVMSQRKKYNTLEIIDFGDGRIIFHILAELHTTDRSGFVPKGESCGGLYLKDNKANYKNREGNCILNFTFSENTVQTEQPSDCYDFNVTAQGLYTKKSSEKPQIDCKY